MLISTTISLSTDEVNDRQLTQLYIYKLVLNGYDVDHDYDYDDDDDNVYLDR